MRRILSIAVVAAAPVAHAQPIRDVVITLEDCRLLERHVPSADATYRPGVDVHGRPVAPADLGGGSAVQLPPVLQFQLAVNPLQGLRRGTVPPGFGNTAMSLGTVSVDTRTGQAALDGRPLGPAEREAALVACRAAPR